MKQRFFYQKIVLTVFTMLTVLSNSAQQQFTITSSRENNYCNSTCTQFNNPDLNGNPNAIIFVTQVSGNGAIKDLHPICAYYNGKLWSVMNVDNGSMPVGAQFNVQYYTGPDESHFVHIVTKENTDKSNSYIDHAGLNGNPKAQFQTFQNVAPNVRGGLMNTVEIKTQYDESAGKWFIANSNGKLLDAATGYNISISSGTNNNTTPDTTTNPAPVNSNSPALKQLGQEAKVYMTVVGKTQGQFVGEYVLNRIELTNLDFEINSARDLSTGMSSGKRQYAPIMVEKETDQASIQFFKAITSNEQLTSVKFEVYSYSRTTSVIGAVLDYTIVLGNASISGFKQSYMQDQKGLKLDSIKIVFQSITMTKGAVSVADSWNTVQ